MIPVKFDDVLSVFLKERAAFSLVSAGRLYLGLKEVMIDIPRGRKYLPELELKKFDWIEQA